MGGFLSFEFERRTPMRDQKRSNNFTKTIGKATYQVYVYFNENSKDSFNDKLFRLIKNDIAKSAKAHRVSLR